MVGGGEALFEGDAGLPAGGFDFGDVQQLARGAVGFAGVGEDFASESNGFCDQLGELKNGDFLAGADVDPVRWGIELEEVEAGAGEIIGVEEFAAGGSGSPHGDGCVAVFLGFVEAADEGGDDVGVFRVVVVAGAVKVGRHGAVVEQTVLSAVMLAEFESGDFRDGVGFVGGLKGRSQQAIFGHRLGCHFRVDAGRAEEEDAFDTGAAAAFDEVGFDRQVLVKEIGGVGGVGVDAADFGGRDDDDLGFLFGDEIEYRLLVAEVELTASGRDNAVFAESLRFANEC